MSVFHCICLEVVRHDLSHRSAEKIKLKKQQKEIGQSVDITYYVFMVK